MEDLNSEVQRLLRASMAPASWNSYRKCLENFINFRFTHHLDQLWAVPHVQITTFIAFLSLGGWAPSSINSHLSALSFVHKINGWQDPSNNFLVKKLKEGCKRSSPRVDSRLPITPTLLEKLIRSLSCICSTSLRLCYSRLLFF